MRLCVVGAGAAGLATIKRGVEFGCEVTAFELTNTIGGLWNYTDQVGKDKYGVDIHSSMYQGLVTNGPIEVMCYPDNPFPEQKRSFVPSEEIRKYYQSFADKYDLRKFINFRHQVVNIRPVGEEWEVIVRDLPTGLYSTHTFDSVLVCNGHFQSSFIPKYEGQTIFQGKQFHSHDYRCSEPFQNLNVLVIGGSYSGFDIVLESAKYAKNVMWSHHLEKKPATKWFQTNVVQMPDVTKFTKSGAEFVDGSFHEFDIIIYCTGYEYKFPFLSVDCGISTEEKFVKPLYMQCLSIHRPTLGFIGLPDLIVPNPTFDLQARFCLTFMTGRKKLPSKIEMMKDYEQGMEEQRGRGLSGKKLHYLGGDFQQNYYVGLAEKAGVEPLKPYIAKIHSQCLLISQADFVNFRKTKFHIIDDENYDMSMVIEDDEIYDENRFEWIEN